MTDIYRAGNITSEMGVQSSPDVVLARFLSRIVKPSEESCWTFLGTKVPSGYGTINGHKTRVYAHRYAWMIANSAPIPPGMFVCHSCDNPSCVNPSHLFLGTPKQNTSDARRKNRLGRRGSLTREQGQQIISLVRAGGRTQGDIGRQFGVSREVVNRLVRGKTYKSPARFKPARDVADDMFDGTRLKAVRESRRMTQMELAEASRVTQPTISELERGGIKRPSYETVIKLSTALGVDATELFSDVRVVR